MRAFRDTLTLLLYMSLSSCRGGQGTLRDANNRHMGEAVPATVQTKFNKSESKMSVKKVMFDVDVLVDISLTRMDVHGGNKIKIFMKEGSFDGHGENRAAWNPIFKKSDEDQILLKRGETYSFYLKGKGMEVNTLNKKSTFDDDYFIDNNFMSMTKCVASKSKFTKNSMNAVWNGELVVSQAFKTVPEPVSCSDPNLNCQQCLENGCGWVGSCISSCNIIADVRCYDTGRTTDFQSAVNDSCEKYETDSSDSSLCYGKSSDCETCTSTLKSNNEPCLWHGSFCDSEGNMAGPGSSICEANDVNADACTTDDDCSAGKWCASHSIGANFCKEYAAPSASCEFFTLPEYMEYCNSETHYCYKPESCVIPDAAGTCELKDTHRSKVGDCCSSSEDCESGTCSNGQTYIGTTQQVCVEENKSNIGNPVNTDKDDICFDSSLSCQECLEKECGWAGQCLPSCDMIADVSCYDTFQAGSIPLDVCEKAAKEQEDHQLCSSVTPENSCTACTQTTKSNGEQCVWIEMPPLGSFCASEGGMFGPGITQCPFEGVCPEAQFTEFKTVCNRSYIPVMCNNGQCGYGNECEAEQAGFSMIDDCVLVKV